MSLNIKNTPFYQEVRRDFEGMADAKAVLLKCRERRVSKCGPTYKDGVVVDPTVQEIDHGVQWAWDVACQDDDPKALRDAVRTITLNLTYELADQCDIDAVDYGKVIETAYVVREVLTVPEWSNVSDEDIERILNSPDEE